MSNYAAYDGTQIIDVIVADNKELAEQVSGLQCFDQEEISSIVQNVSIDADGNETISEITVFPGVGWTLEQDGWRPPKPEGNFEWNGQGWSQIISDEEDIV